MAALKPVRLLIVDDEPVVRDSLGGWFEEEGYSVDLASSGKEALEKLAARDWDIFLVDIKMPGMDGLELQRKILEAHPRSTIIIMTAFASVETAVAAMKQGAYDYVVKPFDPEDLERLIRKAAERGRLLSENDLLRRRIDEESPGLDLVGKSPAIVKAREEIGLVAAVPTPVLLRGESGTGKKLVARAIHSLSPKRYLPFSIVNCGGVPDDVLQSELFGHERGAFPGARHHKRGKFEMVEGGTLFLDEVGGLETKTQVDLLRAMEDRRITSLGGSAPVPVDFRLLAASARDLEALLAEGKFREDLFHHLNAFTIRLPPLRERKEDLPLLALHFLEKYSRITDRPISGISPEAMEVLAGEDWPGNVRELENAIERAVLVCRSGEISPEDLPMAAPAPGKSSGASPEREKIERALAESEWNLSRAARLLQTDRAELYLKMKKHGLGRE